MSHSIFLRYSFFMSLLIVSNAVSSFAFAQDGNLGALNCPPGQSSGVSGVLGTANDVKAALDNYEEAPFAKACKKPGLLKDRPSTAFYHVFPPAHDNQGHLSLDFFARVQKKVMAKIKENEAMGKALAYCADPSHGDLQCSSTKNWMQTDLPKRLQSIRYNLALANNPQDSPGIFGYKQKLSDLNSDLHTIGSYKENAWEPLSASEKADASRVLDIYKVKALTESAGNEKPKQFAKDMIRSLRTAHFEEYLRQMSQIPFAQYLKTGNPNGDEIKSAAQQFTKNVVKERKKIDGMSKDIDEAKKHGNGLPNNLMELLNYSSLVEETLIEAPEFCGLATSLIYSRSNQKVAVSIAIGLPVLAATIFAPPLGAAVVGIAGGVIGLANSQLELNEAKNQGLNSFYEDEDPTAMKLREMSDAKESRDFDFVNLPLGYGLGSYAVSSTKVMAKAAFAATRIGSGTNALRATTSIASEMRAALKPAVSIID